MKSLSNRNKAAFALGGAWAGVVAFFAACSGGGTNGSTSSDGGATKTTTTRSDGSLPPPVDAGFVSTQPGSCTNPTVPIIFSPMYSAFIPGNAGTTFSIPAVTADGNAATWSLSDPTQANLQLAVVQ